MIIAWSTSNFQPNWRISIDYFLYLCKLYLLTLRVSSFITEYVIDDANKLFYRYAFSNYFER